MYLFGAVNIIKPVGWDGSQLVIMPVLLSVFAFVFVSVFVFVFVFVFVCICICCWMKEVVWDGLGSQLVSGGWAEGKFQCEKREKLRKRKNSETENTENSKKRGNKQRQVGEGGNREMGDKTNEKGDKNCENSRKNRKTVIQKTMKIENKETRIYAEKQ